MKKRKIKKITIIIFIIIIALIGAGIAIKNYLDLINSNEYKLQKLGYSENDIEIISKLDDSQTKEIIKEKYNKMYPKFIKQKYFIYDNLDRYLDYYRENKNDKLSHIVSMVNVNADYDYYDEEIVKETNINENELMLVNKYHKLSNEYAPEDLVDINIQFAYGDNQIKSEVYEKFRSMYNDAKKEGLYLIITSAYREYEYQEELWQSYKNQQGEEWADSVAARAGFSEHQTGLTLDIVTYNATMKNFEETAEFKWLQENSYKYGFILRYPKDKEDITGYSYESWHYRYVGEDVAKEIHKLGITFDEYYAYYIENKS